MDWSDEGIFLSAKPLGEAKGSDTALSIWRFNVGLSARSTMSAWSRAFAVT